MSKKGSERPGSLRQAQGRLRKAEETGRLGTGRVATDKLNQGERPSVSLDSGLWTLDIGLWTACNKVAHYPNNVVGFDSVRGELFNTSRIRPTPGIIHRYARNVYYRPFYLEGRFLVKRQEGSELIPKSVKGGY